MMHTTHRGLSEAQLWNKTNGHELLKSKFSFWQLLADLALANSLLSDLVWLVLRTAVLHDNILPNVVQMRSGRP
jgi:hypothetical protein